MRAAAIQFLHRASVDEALEAAHDAVLRAHAGGAGIILLPEYFAAPSDAAVAKDPKHLAGRADDVARAVARMSRETGAVVAAASLAERDGGIVNEGYVYAAGKPVGVQRKVHPMPNEEAWGLIPGEGFHVFEVGDLRLGVLVCADVLYPEAPRIMSLDNVDIILNPVMSPWRGDDDEDVTRVARESMFVARSWDAAAFVIKAGATSPNRKAVGRSLIAAPWGVLARYRDPWAEEVLLADLDLVQIREFRKTHRGLQARQPDAYRRLIE